MVLCRAHWIVWAMVLTWRTLSFVSDVWYMGVRSIMNFVSEACAGHEEVSFSQQLPGSSPKGKKDIVILSRSCGIL